jgi:GH43 family beta-xylosidase
VVFLLPTFFSNWQQKETEPSKTFTNPLWRGADPWIIKHDGIYYTCRTAGSGIEVTSSRFLTRIEERKIVWHTPREGWNCSNIWAPELHHINGKWYIYYAAALKAGQPFIFQRTGVLECDMPLGTYRDMGQLYTGDDPEQRYENIWSIDMTVFKHKEKLYAVWSGWEHNNYTDATDQLLYIAHMPTPVSIGKRVLLSKPEEPWERGEHIALLEGPAVIQHDGNVFIMYSTRGSWTIHYKIGQLLLRSADSDPLDPQSWIKSGPVFQGNTDVLGVGHASFTTSPDDSEWWIYYHSKLDTVPGWNRAVCLQPFLFDAQGNPFFGAAVKPKTPINRPSGEYERELNY